jgi:hypothetical protein
MAIRYQITLHSVEEFKDVVYFCSEDGNCRVEQVSADQLVRLEELLNQQGRKGWDLVQMSFGKQGILVVWKQEMAPNHDRSVKGQP